MLEINRDASLLPLNTMGINGTVRYLVEWESEEDLRDLFGDSRYADIVGCGVKNIGQGSNLLFVNDQYPGAIARCRSRRLTIAGEDDDFIEIEASAGVSLDDLAAYCCRQGWWGLENLSLIPGTIGGAAVQNVGAYGVEFKDVVNNVSCYDVCSHERKVFSVEDIGYAYRDSMFKHSPAKERYIVMSVELKLSKKANPRLQYGNLDRLVENHNDILSIREAVVAMRRSKLPEVGETGSAGSFFKNPVLTDAQYEQALKHAAGNGIEAAGIPVFHVDGGHKLSAAWLIDKAGWKGVSIGHALVWPRQPLVIVNADGCASGRDIADMAQRIMDDIYEKFGIRLETEVEYI